MMTGDENTVSSRNGVLSSRTVQRVRVVPAVTSGCLTIIGLILFNAFPDVLGIVRSAANPDSYILRLGPAFFSDILPRLNVLWAFNLGVILTNLYYGYWSWGTRLLDCALTIFSVAILAKLLLGGDAYLALQWQELEMLAVHIAGRSVPLVIIGVKAALAGALVGAVASLGVKVRPLVVSGVRDGS